MHEDFARNVVHILQLIYKHTFTEKVRGLSQKFIDFWHKFPENDENRKQTTYPLSSTFYTHVCKILQ